MHTVFYSSCSLRLHSFLEEGPGSWSPLAEASQHAQPECVRLLLEAGSEVNVRNNEKNTPLHLVVWPCIGERKVKRQAEVLQLLIGHGVSIDAKGLDDMTPLAAACQWKSLRSHWCRYSLTLGRTWKAYPEMVRDRTGSLVTRTSCFLWRLGAMTTWTLSRRW